MITWLEKIFGSRNERVVKTLRPLVAYINSLESQMASLSDETLKAKTEEFKRRLAEGETLDELLPEAFAVVRETGKRTLGLRHFDAQLMGGMVLHQGKISEMRTGEGKTLVATLPVYLNGLTGRGVHVVTVNDYLAERDSLGRGNFRGMGEIYRFLGLTVGCVKHGISTEERRAAYAADITYGTNNEFGFDYLRDNMVTSPDERVQRPFYFAVVDEVDSILIDEARTPLIISGPAEESTDLYHQLDRLVRQLKKDDDYTIEERTKTVAVTEDGVAKLETLLNIPNLYDPLHITKIHHVQAALRAHSLFKKDHDYIVKDGQVIIVDEFTGRLMPGRRYSDGLHQALEAKENVKVERENQTLATVTFQNYFRMYEKLSGMTGTAVTEAAEFWEIYKLDVVTIPTHRPMVREDRGDLVYRTRREKLEAVVEEIHASYEKGQPVLVGTISIEHNEELSGMLNRRGVTHKVLNAKYHEQEAEIIAQAGQKGGVTVATNMAGRGVDIVLGEGVKALGGLHMLGTERHEARRIDNQLRGRSGRQGDPGSSQFYLSLEDDLMRIFGSDRITKIMERFGGMEEGMVISHGLVSRSIERAQKMVEGHNFEIRKHLLEYDDVMNKQREVIYAQRKRILEGQDLGDQLQQMIEDVVEVQCDRHVPEKSRPSEWDLPGLKEWLQSTFGIGTGATLEEFIAIQPLKEFMLKTVQEAYARREETIGGEMFRQMERWILLQVIDGKWKDHLYAMDQLKEGIGLRAYAQKDPLIEYKKEGFEMFVDLIFRVKEEALAFLSNILCYNELAVS